MGLIGRAPAKNSIKTMKKIGVDISTQRSAGISKEDLDWADYVLVMTPTHAKKLRAMLPSYDDKILILANFGGMMKIEDPVGKWIFAFHSCRKSIEKSLHGFAKQIAKRTASD